MNTGRLPSGGRTRNAAVPSSFFQNVYLANNQLPANLPPVTPNSPDFRAPYQRVFEAFGSNTHRGNFILTDRQINGVKGALFILNAPITDSRFRALVQQGVGGDNTATEQFIQEIRAVSGSILFYYETSAQVTTDFLTPVTADRLFRFFDTSKMPT